MRRNRAVLFQGCALAALFGVAANAETVTYKYDALGRLVKAQTTGGVDNNRANSLCYDRAGNRVKYKSDPGGTLAACPSLAATPTPSPTPTPTPTPVPTPSPTPTPTPTPSPTPTPTDPPEGCHYEGSVLVCT